MITSVGGHVKTISRETNGTTVDMLNAIHEQYVNNVDFIKLIVSGGLLTPNSSPKNTEIDKEIIFNAIAHSKILGLKTAAHVYNNNDIKSTLQAGVNSIEHASFASEDTLRMAAEKNITLVPTIKPLYDIIEHKDILPEYMFKNAAMVLENMKRLITNARKYNVKIAMGTDAGTPFNYHGDNLRELELLSEYGLSNWEIFNSATKIPAELLDIDKSYGIVKEGYVADLLLVDKNPIEDISALRKNLKCIIFNGTLYKDFKN
jgi:imidazolonepropionase-like amidohydrolase